MSELAIRQIDLATLLEQLDHGGLFPLEDAVDRIAARRLVVETAGGVALLPSPHPLPIELRVGPLWLGCVRTELVFGRLAIASPRGRAAALIRR